MPSLPDAGDHHPTVLMITALVALACREHTGGPKWIRVLIAALVLVASLGSLPRLGDYFPGQLFV